MTLVYIAVFIVSLAFALVSIYIAKLLMRTSTIISTLGQTVNAAEEKLDKIIVELEEMIVETTSTATDVETKLLATDGLFLTMQNIGDTTAIVSEDLHTRTKRYADDTSLPGAMPFVQAIQLGEFSLSLFRSWKKGQHTSSMNLK